MLSYQSSLHDSLSLIWDTQPPIMSFSPNLVKYIRMLSFPDQHEATCWSLEPPFHPLTHIDPPVSVLTKAAIWPVGTGIPLPLFYSLNIAGNKQIK